jgi:IclR family transcriptional regulator, acetate operon repressor
MRSVGRNRRPSTRRDPVRRALQILRLLASAEQADWGVRELAQALGMAPSSSHRILGLLRDEGFLEIDAETKRYRPSFEFFRIGSQAATKISLGRAALPIVRDLVNLCDETVLVGVYDPGRMAMMFVASVESSKPLRYILKLHEWLPVYVGSGFAIMAFLPEEERRAIVGQTRLRPITDRTITEPAELERQLAKVRRQGYSCTKGQRIPGAVGIAAPVFGPPGRVVGNISVTIPEQRFDAALAHRIGGMLVEHAARISAAIGGPAAVTQVRAFARRARA